MRYWEFEYQGGIEPVQPTFNEAVDEACRVGLRAMIAAPEDVTQAVTAAELKFHSLVAGGIALKPSEDAATAVAEGEALVVAIIRSYRVAGARALGRMELPASPWPELDLGMNIGVLSPPDVIAIPEDGPATVIFWRFVAGRNDVDSFAERHRITPTVITAERVLGRPVQAAIQYICKGTRRDGHQFSPLIRGYRHGSKFDWKHTPGWSPFLPSKHPAIGILAWLANLPRTVIEDQFRLVVQSEDFSLLDMVSEHGRKEWLMQVHQQEAQIVDNEQLVPNMIDYLWPQYRHSDRFCRFTAICDQRISQPETTGLFRLKA